MMAGMAYTLIGGGGHALSVIDAILARHNAVDAYSDPRENRDIERLTGALHLLDEDGLPESSRCALALGGLSPAALERRCKLMDARHQWPSVIHPSAYISRHAHVSSRGAQVLARAVINAGARIGDGVIVNTGAIIEHGAAIGRGCHVAPGAIVLGDATVGLCSFIGAGAVVVQGSFVPDHSFVKAGTVWNGHNRMVSHAAALNGDGAPPS